LNRLSSRSFRVALIAGRYPVASETFVQNLAVGLARRGHDIHVLTFQEGSRSGPPPPPELAGRIHHGRRFVQDRRKQYRRIYKVLPKLAAHPWTAWRGARAGGFRTVYQGAPFFGMPGFDILHCQFGHLVDPVLRMRDAGILRGNVVTSWRGKDLGVYVGATPSGFARAFREPAQHLPVCEQFAERLEALGVTRSKMTIFRSGLDTTQFTLRDRSPAPDGTPRIGIIGRLVEKKGIEYALRALAHHPAPRLEIVGEGELRTQLEALADDLGITERVRFLGQRPHADVRALLQEWHIVLAPSVTAANGDTDGPVNALKEAMATGLPVIGTLHGGIPELIVDGVNGYLVPQGDTPALAEALGRLLGRPEQWDAMGRAGATRVRELFDLERQLDLLEEIYAAVLAG